MDDNNKEMPGAVESPYGKLPPSATPSQMMPQIIDPQKVAQCMEILGCKALMLIVSKDDHQNCSIEHEHKFAVEAASHGFPMAFAQGVINHIAGNDSPSAKPREFPGGTQ